MQTGLSQGLLENYNFVIQQILKCLWDFLSYTPAMSHNAHARNKVQ